MLAEAEVAVTEDVGDGGHGVAEPLLELVRHPRRDLPETVLVVGERDVLAVIPHVL